MKPISSLVVDRSACLGIIASATEVFPKECVGVIFRHREKTTLSIAIPAQIANRRKASVESDSPLLFSAFAECGDFIRVCGYHSHPYGTDEKSCGVEPSKCDMEGIKVGDIEVIVNVRRRRKKAEFWRTCAGSLMIGHGRFVFEVAAFMRMEGSTSKGPLYKKIELRLGD